MKDTYEICISNNETAYFLLSKAVVNYYKHLLCEFKEFCIFKCTVCKKVTIISLKSKFDTTIDTSVRNFIKKQVKFDTTKSESLILMSTRARKLPVFTTLLEIVFFSISTTTYSYRLYLKNIIIS